MKRLPHEDVWPFGGLRERGMSELNSVLLGIDVGTRQRDEAGKLMARVQRDWRGAQDQMEQLEAYAADTEARWAVSAQVRSTPEIVRHYYQFMERLQQAIALQGQALAGLDKELATARKLLLEAEIRIASLNQLLERKRTGIHRQQAKREQKQLDEFAAMQHRRLRAELDPRETP